MIKMALKFLNIIKKNLQFFWNNKLSSLIFLFGPLILILIVGAAVQDISVKNINAGLYISEEGPNTENFFRKLEARSFNVGIETSLETCKNNVREGNSHVCIELKKALNSTLPLDSGNYPNYDVKIYVDFSKQRIVWSIIGKIQGIVDEESYNARNLLIANLKEDAEELSRMMQSRESEIDLAISYLEDLDAQLDVVSQEEQTANQKLGEISNNISEIIEELTYIKIGVPLPTIYSTYLDDAISSLENLKQNIAIIQGTSSPIGNAKTYVGIMGDQLEGVKFSLEEARADLDRLSEENLERISNPISLEYESVEGGEEGTIEKPLGFLDYLFPSFLMFFILFNTIIFSSVIRIRERKSKAYIRNIASKVSGFNFVLGDSLTGFIFAIAQAVIILGVASFFLNINLLSNWLSLSLILLLAILSFVLIGIAIGSIFRTQEATIIAAVCMSLLLFIFSSMIVPVETLPPLISKIVGFLPLTLLETKLRLILIFGSALNLSLMEISSLALIGLISILLTFIFYKKSKEKEI